MSGLQPALPESRALTDDLLRLVRPGCRCMKCSGPKAETGWGPVSHRMIEIPAGKTVVVRLAGRGFGWDNENEEHEIDLAAFSNSKYKVTNGEYLDDLRQGGAAPHYWIERRGGRFYQRVFGDAAWKGMRLPAEAEWHRAGFADRAEDQWPYPSPAARALLRRSFRNWFRPRNPNLYAGFRCVAD